MQAILDHANTLENVRISDCKAFDSLAIQTLLCSAPRLKRFDVNPSDPWELMKYNRLRVADILESNRYWVCLELESFKCFIDEIPRSDIPTDNNAVPLNGGLDNPTAFSRGKSQSIQRQIMDRIGRLTKLREISLGQDITGWPQDSEEEDEIFADYGDQEDQLRYQYQCLSMTLEDGLDLLKDLKCMRRLFLERMSHRQQSPEQDWMRENWPDFGKESRDSFWTERGHTCEIGASFKERGISTVGWEDFDWW